MSSSNSDAKCQEIIEWLRVRNIRVVVWDMDQTMSGGHCGSGQPRAQLDQYLDQVSLDFIALSTALAQARFKQAVGLICFTFHLCLTLYIL